MVTLVAEPQARCWGMAYRLRPSELDQVLSGLDQRERGGYERRSEPLWFGSSEPPTPGLVYIATPQNPNYLGPAEPAEMITQIRRSHGPSGPNLEYLQRLADALRELGADDEHVFALDALLRG